MFRVKRNVPLVIVLAILIAAAGCCSVSNPSAPQAVETTGSGQQLLDRIDALEDENGGLREQLDRQNISIRSYENQLDFYRAQFGNSTCPVEGTSPAGTIEGSASLDAPAVLQRAVYERNGPFVYQRIEEEGSLLDISVEIVPGRGRVLVQTTPLMGEVFQDAANTAVFVAQKKTGRDLTASDVIVSIVAEDEVPAVDGGSAGALMTLLVISAIQGSQPSQDVIMTGTIDQDGRVGMIGGVVEKAKAAKKAGKTLFLLPRENRELVRYTEQERDYYGYTVVQRVPERIDAKEYIESEIGIRIEYVDTIDDVLRLVG